MRSFMSHSPKARLGVRKEPSTPRRAERTEHAARAREPGNLRHLRRLSPRARRSEEGCGRAAARHAPLASGSELHRCEAPTRSAWRRYEKSRRSLTEGTYFLTK